LLKRVARLSNFLRRFDPSDNQDDNHDAGTLVCRPVMRHEIDDALRMLVATGDRVASDEQVLDFLSFAVHRGMDVNATWVVVRGSASRLEWAVLPVVSPGRTMLVLSPAQPLRHTPVASIEKLMNEVCAHYAMRDVHLAQILFEPEQTALRGIYAACGFVELAELAYLHRTVRRAAAAPEALPATKLLTHHELTYDYFRQVVAGSYEGSLDCPGLNGRRDIDDVLAGHRASGEFDPRLWHVLVEERPDAEPRPLGALLLSKSLHADALELVYLGLMPDARGRGLGDFFMQLALAVTAREERSALSLAVDSRNTPALRLYYRYGMQRVGSRIAMIRDLRERSTHQAGLSPLA
jgi:ribosomal protein S18 acetylase RimI-like enzyme